MARQALNNQQQIWDALSTEYPGLQVKSGRYTISLTAGDNDYGVNLGVAKFPNAVLFSQISWGGPSTTWNLLPRAAYFVNQGATNLEVGVHYYSSMNQTAFFDWVAFGY